MVCINVDASNKLLRRDVSISCCVSVTCGISNLGVSWNISSSCIFALPFSRCLSFLCCSTSLSSRHCSTICVHFSSTSSVSRFFCSSCWTFSSCPWLLVVLRDAVSVLCFLCSDCGTKSSNSALLRFAKPKLVLSNFQASPSSFVCPLHLGPIIVVPPQVLVLLRPLAALAAVIGSPIGHW